jgi:hypothetical protein
VGWSQTGLRARRKGEPRKAALARELRSKTTLSHSHLPRHRTGASPYPLRMHTLDNNVI